MRFVVNYLHALAADVIFQHFSVDREISPDAWLRFESYARRIRKFSYVEDIEPQRLGWKPSSVMITDDTWDSIARTRIAHQILPNLTDLTWIKGVDRSTYNHQIQWLPMLIGSKLKTLVVAMPSHEEKEFAPLLSNIVFRAPNLEHLEIQMLFGLKSEDSDSEMEPALISAIHSWKWLRSLKLPAFWYTTCVMNAISALPALHTATQDFFSHTSHGEAEDVISFKPQLSEGAFPALTTLHLACDASDITDFFLGYNHPRFITDLMLHSPNNLVHSTELTTLIDALPFSLPSLVRLHLDFRIDEPRDESEMWIPDLALLEPVKLMSRLETLRFHYQWPLDIRTDSLRDFVPHLRNLRELELNQAHFQEEMGWEPQIDHTSLLIFAQHCPLLEELGIFVRMDPDEMRDTRALHFPSLYSFLHPMRLDFGVSYFAEKDDEGIDELANFLGQICSAGCDVHGGYSRQPDDLRMTGMGVVWRVRDDEIWEEVNKRLQNSVRYTFDVSQASLTSSRRSPPKQINIQVIYVQCTPLSNGNAVKRLWGRLDHAHKLVYSRMSGYFLRCVSFLQSLDLVVRERNMNRRCRTDVRMSGSIKLSNMYR
jgi:hypothetical protein